MCGGSSLWNCTGEPKAEGFVLVLCDGVTLLAVDISGERSAGSLMF